MSDLPTMAMLMQSCRAPIFPVVAMGFVLGFLIGGAAIAWTLERLGRVSR